MMTKEHSHAQVLRWIADGKTVQYPCYAQHLSASGFTTDVGDLLHFIRNRAPVERFTLVPRTIKVGSREINPPLDVALAYKSEYWIVYSDGSVTNDCWVNHSSDQRRLAHGNIWSTEADATAARDAWRELMKGQA